jgi:glycosyltransferase involved in cell wall biosynthesis
MDAILCGSRSGAAEAVASLDLSPERVHAVTTGADHWLRYARPRTADELKQAGPPRFLVLGAISTARSPLAILAGFEAHVKPRTSTALRPQLIFSGRPGDAAPDFAAALQASPAADCIHWIQEPIESNLPGLVANSAALIHLSQGELAPITPLEALTFGAAVIATDLPAFREALGNSPGVHLTTEASQNDPTHLASLFEQATESGWNDEHRTARQIQAAPHTWQTHAQETLELYLRLRRTMT